MFSVSPFSGSLTLSFKLEKEKRDERDPGVSGKGGNRV